MPPFYRYGNPEIRDKIRPALIGINAPLSLPRGRRSIHDRTENHLRHCDRELTSRKIRCFPVTLGPMRKLTERGLLLKDHLLKLESARLKSIRAVLRIYLAFPESKKVSTYCVSVLKVWAP